MAIYRLPPSPFVGGRQPLAPKDLNPEFEAVEPPAVDSPPVRSRYFIPILVSWFENVWLVQTQSSFIFEAEDQPVPYPRPQIQVILEELPLPQQAKKIAPLLPEPEPPSEYNPYRRQLIALHAWHVTIPPIQKPTFLPVEGPVVVVEFVPYTRPLIELRAWNITSPYYQRRVSVPTEGPAVVTFVPYTRPLIELKSWVDTPFNYQRQVFIVQEGAAPVVDNPPFGRRVLWLNTVLDAWIPPPPVPTMPIHYYTPPPSGDIILWMWKRIA